MPLIPQYRWELKYEPGYFEQNKMVEKLIITSKYISYKRTFTYLFVASELDSHHSAEIYWKKEFCSEQYPKEIENVILSIMGTIYGRNKDICVLDGDGLEVVGYRDDHKVFYDDFCPSVEPDIISNIRDTLLPFIDDMPFPLFLNAGKSAGVYMDKNNSKTTILI